MMLVPDGEGSSEGSIVINIRDHVVKANHVICTPSGL